MNHSDAFGELRDLLDRDPSLDTWQHLTDLVETIRAEGDWDRFAEEALPYAEAVLLRWPADLPRRAPLAWINRLCWEGDEDEDAEEPSDLLDDPWFPDTFDEPRRAGDTPELALCNTLLLSDQWELDGFDDYRPLDRLAHAFLRDCPHLRNLHTLLHGEEVGENPYGSGTMVSPAQLGYLLSGSAWRGARTLRIGAFPEETIASLPLAQLHTLELLPSHETTLHDLYDPEQALHELLHHPGADSLRTLGLGRLDWTRLDLQRLLDSPHLTGLAELRILSLNHQQLDDTLEAHLARFTHLTPPRPMTLTFTELEGYDAQRPDLLQLNGQTINGWTVRVHAPA